MVERMTNLADAIERLIDAKVSQAPADQIDAARAALHEAVPSTLDLDAEPVEPGNCITE